MSVGQWINDLRWAMNMKRVRAMRREMFFSERIKFDSALRPPIDGEPGVVVDYPDAFYHVTIEDIVRGVTRSRR